MLERRSFIHAASLTAGLAALAGARLVAASPTPHPAASFLDSVRQRAIDRLTDDSISEADREATFRGLLNEAFDIPTIGRFVVGRYWRSADEAQRHAFLEVFEDAIVQRFLPLFSQYKGEQLIVEKAAPDKKNPKLAVVDSTYIDAQGRSAKVSWRVRERKSSYQIFDVVVEGVSMAITLRSEYASVIKNAG
ncbi:MAG: phospholipid-binding protein MlaC, partial [Dehalococcoidia bacterium]